MAEIDPTTVKRLTFIRLIYQQGLEQSQRPEPLSMTGILSFHDAVELFLVLAGEHLHAQLPDQTKFLDYWTRLSPTSPTNKNGISNGVNLTGKTAMDRLNRLRNGFKHAGSLPGKDAIEQARIDVTNFFLNNTPLVFGADVGFANLDLTDVVTQSFARDKLRAAADNASQDDYHEAVELLAETFFELLNDYANRKKSDYRYSVYDFGGQIPDLPPFSRRDLEQLNRDFADHYEQLTKSAAEIQQSMQVIALGLDYRHYARFKMITPRITQHYSGSLHRTPKPWLPHSRDDYEFCRDFVITTSLRLAEVDFDLNLDDLYETWHHEIRASRQQTPASSPAPHRVEPTPDER